jgi:hypothetical protein
LMVERFRHEEIEETEPYNSIVLIKDIKN